ncbi:MAG TPA: pyridine nucleotide-disulfide oxidoreductase [Gammaproteobacteria bacterium]|nr:pyridine nucleotide-disulfide oxidoreductase [Gammaproteobacteria bacterium]
MNKTKVLIVIAIIAALGSFYMFDLGRFITLEFAQSQITTLQEFRDENFLLTAAIYFVGYVAVAALSLPGALILTLLGGAIFGLLWGLLLVSFASSIGATCSFLVSRLLLREWVQSRFGDYLAPINKGIEKDGNFYLFSIRMVPLFPFFMVNLLMGLTPIPARSFYIVSQIGMLMGTAVYVNAGSELAQISSLSGMVSGPVIFSLVLLGVFPLVGKLIVNTLQKNKTMKGFAKPKSFDANVVVIGGGSAGLVSAIIAVGAKAKTVLVEKHKMGGDCLNTGCVPSKSIIRSGRIMSYIRRAREYGLTDASAAVDFPAVMDRVQGVIKIIEPHDSVERFTSLGVECVQGNAYIKSPFEVEVDGRTITTRSIIVATGARPLVPPIPGLEDLGYLTSDSIWELRELPKRLLVVGGGPIGCELAQAFSNLGAKVTQVDMASRIMPWEDPEVSAAVMQQFEKDGINVLTDHRLTRFLNSNGVKSMEAEHHGETVTVEFDEVLLAIGRKPNTEGFGLEELDMPLTPSGTIEINNAMQTAYPNIFACGDVAGPYQFTHMASFQAYFAALNSLLGGIWQMKANYRVVPWATFTDPEVARVGLSEQEAKDRNIPYEITRYELDHHDRALADGEAHGFVKVLTVPGKDKILGVTILGYHAGELIGEFVFAMTHGMGLKKISAVTHIYPTLSESNKFAANAWRSVRLPEKYFPIIEKFFRWQRGAG